MSDLQQHPTPPDDRSGGRPTSDDAPRSLAKIAEQLQIARKNAESLDAGHPPLADRTEPVQLVSRVLDTALDELLVVQEELRTRAEQFRNVERLVTSERARYRELLEGAPVAYVATDIDGAIRDSNRAAGVLLGCSCDALMGRPLIGFVPEGARRRFRRLIADMRNREIERDIPLPVQPLSAASLTAVISVAAGRDEHGTITELRWLMVDHSGREAQERDARARELAEQSNNAKSELLAMVSHELRTPLAAIAGYADLLAMGARGQLTEPQLADMRRIRQAQMHLSLVVDDLLSFTKLGAGKLHLEISDFLLADALADTGVLIAPQAEMRSIKYRLDGGDSDAMVHADRERLRQIIVNLLSNAVKFTRPGGSIRLSWRCEREHVAIMVRDDGVGIDPARLEDIFQPFVQLRESGTDVAAGTGLGLAISRSLASAMGGDLAAASKPGEGSTFTLRLPRSARVSI